MDDAQPAPSDSDGQDEDVSISSSSFSSFDSDSDDNEDNFNKKQLLNPSSSGTGTPVLDERIKGKYDGKLLDSPNVISTLPPREELIGSSVTQSISAVKEHSGEDFKNEDKSSVRQDNTKHSQPDDVYSKPSALKLHLEKQQNTGNLIHILHLTSTPLKDY